MVWWLLSFLIFFFNWNGTIAQLDASCLPFYNWTSNSVKQSPCQVASSLLAVCNSGPFPVSALPDMSHYIGPSLQDANPCQCNTVTYSLMSACGACQGQTYLSWSVWSTNCPTVYLSSYPEPIPSGVFVPGWAYLDVQANDSFDQFLARQNANLTQSTAVPSPTSTVSLRSQQPISSTTRTSTVLAQSTSTPSSPSTSTVDAQANAVGGGVVGGILGLFILCGLLYGYFQWKKRRSRIGEPMLSRVDTGNPTLGEIDDSMTQVRLTNSTIRPRPFDYSLSTPAPRSTSNSSVSASATGSTDL